MRRFRNVLAGSVLALSLMACSGGEDPAPAPPPDEAPVVDDEPTTAPADAPAVTNTMHMRGSDVQVEIYPVVRTGEHAVLTLDVHRGDDGREEGIFLTSAWGGQSSPVLQVLAGLRLFDLERDMAYIPAAGESRTVSTGESFITVNSGESRRLQVAYAAPPPDVTSLGLFMPGGPYVAEVPVVDGDVPDPNLPGTPAEDAIDPLDLTAVVDAPVEPLESYTRELEGAVQTVTSTEEVRVTLGSDVLFDVDSADLTPESEAALDAAAEHLRQREPGTVHVVGHTDDVMDDAYNQALSERRAESVAAALADRIDTALFDIEAEGRGKREPLVDGTDNESRAMNRRVELTLVSEITETVEIAADGELPPFDGAVATGAEGVEVEVTSGARYHVRAPGARRVHGHLVIDLEVEALNDRAQEVGVLFLSGLWEGRPGTRGVVNTAAGVFVVRGGTAIYPMDHLNQMISSGEEQRLPATDLETRGDIAPGATRTFSIIYPDIGGIDEVTIQSQGVLRSTPFRLTDIPVR